MQAAPGIAGSSAPEVDGCFLCLRPADVEWFVSMNNTGGPVDVWAVDGIDPDHLEVSPTGYAYLPGKIPSGSLTLVRQDISWTSYDQQQWGWFTEADQPETGDAGQQTPR
jgi:hypothetical protein